MKAMKAVRILMMSVLLLGVMTSGGCFLLLLGAAVGTTAYVMGDQEATLDATPEQIVEASKAAVADLKLILISANATGLDGKVVAHNSESKEVTINIKSLSAASSEVSIRAGTFGDTPIQSQLLEKIKENLKK